MNEFELTEEWENTIGRFRKEASPFLEQYLDYADIDWLDAVELMDITEEDIEVFLSRDQINGYWYPEVWADEVIKNFESNTTYYQDKLIRGKKSDRRNRD